MSIDDEALARLRELPERLRHAATTNVNDDCSEPMTEKRTRMIARLDVMLEAANALPALLDNYEAVGRGIDAQLVADCGGIMVSTYLDHAGEMALAGQRVRIVPCTGGGE